MRKKAYHSPALSVIAISHQQHLLIESAAGGPSADFMKSPDISEEE